MYIKILHFVSWLVSKSRQISMIYLMKVSPQQKTRLCDFNHRASSFFIISQTDHSRLNKVIEQWKKNDFYMSRGMGCRPKVWNPLLKRGFINASNRPTSSKGLLTEEDEILLEKSHKQLQELEEYSKKISKSIKKHHDRLICLQKADLKVSSYLLNSPAFEENKELHQMAEIYQKTAYQLGKLTEEFTNMTQKVFIDPMKTFNASFQDIGLFIKKRDLLLSECLKNKSKKEKLEATTIAEKVKLEQAKIAYHISHDEFQKTNDELLKELISFYEIRHKYIDPCVEAYCHAQADYYLESTRLFTILTYTLDSSGYEATKSDINFQKDLDKLLEEFKSVDIVDGANLKIKKIQKK